MGYYVSKLYGYEILRVKATFLTDDDGVIYLSNIDNLYTRVKVGYTEGVLPNGVSFCSQMQNAVDSQNKKRNRRGEMVSGG